MNCRDGRAANICAAADVALDQAFGFEFGVGIRDGGAMDAELRSEFAAGGDAVAVRNSPQWTSARSWSRNWTYSGMWLSGCRWSGSIGSLL